MAWPKGKPRPPGAGRKRGSKNRATFEGRAFWQALVEDLSPKAKQWIIECAEGIEIEKTNPDGTTVVGRFNADPGKAVGLLMSGSEFFAAKLQRIERTLDQYTDAELLNELKRRASLQPLAPEPRLGDESMQ